MVNISVLIIENRNKYEDVNVYLDRIWEPERNKHTYTYLNTQFKKLNITRINSNI